MGVLRKTCFRCKREPNEIEEYVKYAQDEGITPDEFVITQEGTYNEKNGHFCCTDCYVEIGMPSTPLGWIAP